jgi:hypothetical protein
MDKSMNPILFEKNIFVFLFSEALMWFAMFFIAVVSIVLLRKWDFESTSTLQYRLEKRAQLVVTIIVIVAIFKILLLPYFVFTIDNLSAVVPGAMCAAGVVSFDQYGLQLLFLKLLILFLLLLWIVINSADLKRSNYPFFRFKISFVLIVFVLMCIEMLFDFLFFDGIDIHQVINCCSTLYGLYEGMNPLPFGLDITKLLILFYLLYFMIITSYIAKENMVLFISLVLFVYLSYFAVLYFFGTYIYQDPSHNCPFCMMQRDYYYIGYLVWGSLFGGVFVGLVSVVDEYFLGSSAYGLKKMMVLLLSIFVLSVTVYVLWYYYQNGVWLEPKTGDDMAGMIM